MAMVKASNAIVIRATPDTMLLVRRLIATLIRPSRKSLSRSKFCRPIATVPAILASTRQMPLITFTGPNSFHDEHYKHYHDLDDHAKCDLDLTWSN